MDWKTKIFETVEKTKKESFNALNFSTAQKNKFLAILSDNLLENKDRITCANRKDIAKAARDGCSDAFIDRLTLTDERITGMAKGIDIVKKLPDPVGEKIKKVLRPNGLRIEKVRTPIGVIGIIYESRPDVTIEAAALCLKSGNCIVLRGGKEAQNSNRVLVEILKESLKEAALPENLVNLISSGGRKAVRYMLSLEGLIDLIIPRGGESLIRAVAEYSRIPVIKHYKGICHTYVDREADLKMALEISLNAKIQRASTCNAMETLLVHEDIAHKFLPKMADLFTQSGVEMRGCKESVKILKGKNIKKATAEDWDAEYLDFIISIKVVDSVDSAISHINRHGTLHSEAIITENKKTAEKFLKEVDASAIFHNASTRFTDGGQFGLGAEIGISTDKIHARGPMGLEELTVYKYLVYGKGQIRQ